MKRTASAKKKSSGKNTSTKRKGEVRFVLCIDNKGYEASLERAKVYAVLDDNEAERDGDLRVIDESCEDYLFAASRFVAIAVPARARASIRRTIPRRAA